MPDVRDTGKRIWSPPQVPLGVAMAASMVFPRDDRYSENWFDNQRRREAMAEEQKVVSYYERRNAEEQARYLTQRKV